MLRMLCGVLLASDLNPTRKLTSAAVVTFSDTTQVPWAEDLTIDDPVDLSYKILIDLPGDLTD